MPLISEVQKLHRAIQAIRPGSEYSLPDGTVDNIKWRDKNTKQPTQKEIEAAIKALAPDTPLSVDVKIGNVTLTFLRGLLVAVKGDEK